MKASQNGHIACVQLLLSSGADISLVNMVCEILIQFFFVAEALLFLQKTWMSALHKACQEGHVEVANILLDFGAGIEWIDNEVWVSTLNPLFPHCRVMDTLL